MKTLGQIEAMQRARKREVLANAINYLNIAGDRLKQCDLHFLASRVNAIIHEIDTKIR